MGRLQNRLPDTLQGQLQKAIALRSMGVITRGLMLSTTCPKCGKFGVIFSLHTGNGVHHDKDCRWHGKLRDPGVLERLIELGDKVKELHPPLPQHK